MKTIERRLKFIYGTEEKAFEAKQKIEKRLEKYALAETKVRELTQADTMLITYGDSIINGDVPALEVLSDFLDTYVKDAVGNVHLLPMYPYTSDDGFSVVDYKEINPVLGNWEKIEMLAEKYGLMFDAVINHISKSSDWFQKYLRCEQPYTDYFITCAPEADYSKVTRPRALPLLTEFDSAEGPKFVWTTFSEDQIDLNFNSPDVLAEILDILIMYGRMGAKFIRLDAIGFMWKELGTTCMHLPQTHELIKLMKDVLRMYSPETKIITETNVPHKDNISYFGDGKDEADLVYQFPLPPLIMYSLLKGDASILRQWMAGLELPGGHVTFFNFLSSHDGIGVRPTEGILDDTQREFLVEATLKHGGRVSYKDNGDGTKSPYELNINYQDALAGPEDSDEIRIGRFLAAETILLSMQGVPGIYIHSLLGSRNDYYGMTVSDIPRRINREQLDYDFLKEQLDGDTNRGRIFKEMLRRLNIRKQEKAFAPQAVQKVLDMDDRVLAIRRIHEKSGECIEALINVSGETVQIERDGLYGINLLNGNIVKNKIQLTPFEAAWIKNRG
ncbi:MAG: sugar phosphorylase [Lachnospiraceae bacterium]|nr:sugar phosphorylase [Lachnospiraceae bacterium]